jgi:hypothetical protein
MKSAGGKEEGPVSKTTHGRDQAASSEVAGTFVILSIAGLPSVEDRGRRVEPAGNSRKMKKSETFSRGDVSSTIEILGAVPRMAWIDRSLMPKGMLKRGQVLCR